MPTNYTTTNYDPEEDLPSIDEVEPYQYTTPQMPEGDVPDGIISPTEKPEASEYQAPEQYTPEGDALMSNRINDFLDENSPLMQRAAKQGERQAHSRGLLDSSLASEYSTNAVMKQAVPIAQQEAQAFHEAGMADYQGKAQAALANLDYENKANMQNLQASLESQLAQQNTVNQDYLNQRQTAYQGLVSSGLSAQEARQQIQAIEREGTVKSKLSAQDAEQQLALDEQQQGARNYRAELQSATEREIAFEKLAAAEQEIVMNKMNELGTMYQEAAGNIQMQPDLSASAKRKLLKQQQSIYQANMKVVSDMYDVGVSWNWADVSTDFSSDNSDDVYTEPPNTGTTPWGSYGGSGGSNQ